MSDISANQTNDTGQRPLLLAVDDNSEILRAWPLLLAKLPLRLRCLDSAERALEAIGSEPPAALISDHRMPGMTGLELIETVRRRWPAIRLALHTSDPVARSRALQLRVPVLEKGAAVEAFLEFVERLLHGRVPG
jgi:CheY-like chemotaxis protein